MLSPDKVVKIVLAIIKEFYSPESFIGGEDDNGEIIKGSCRDDTIDSFVNSFNRNKVINPQLQLRTIRDKLANHFFGSGPNPWQWKVLV